MALRFDFHPKLRAYWGTIQKAVAERASTAELWQAVRSAAESHGMDLKGVRPADMSRIRGLAARIRNSSEAFDKAAPEDVIDASMISENINSRTLNEQNTTPQYTVRYQHHYIEDGEQGFRWAVSDYTGPFDMTKGDLIDSLEAEAEAWAAKYNVTHVTISDIQISAV